MNRQQRRNISEAVQSLIHAISRYQDVLVALDAEYAFQEADWQAGEPGQANVRISLTLRERIAVLGKMAGEELG